MKKLLAIVSLMCALTVSGMAEQYEQVGEIVEFDTSGDTWYSIVYTADGNLWTIELCDEHNIGDIICAVFEDNGTADPTDDEILDIDFMFNAISRTAGGYNND